MTQLETGFGWGWRCFGWIRNLGFRKWAGYTCQRMRPHEAYMACALHTPEVGRHVGGAFNAWLERPSAWKRIGTPSAAHDWWIDSSGGVEAWTAEIFSDLVLEMSDLSSGMAIEAFEALWQCVRCVEELTKAHCSADGGGSSTNLLICTLQAWI